MFIHISTSFAIKTTLGTEQVVLL